jgi:hypothetical protein
MNTKIKKPLFIGLAVALCLSLIMPTTALAAKPVDFNATGVIDNLDEGIVMPAGNSGRWIVSSRTVTGSLEGDISGAFTMVYKANVASDQSGNLHGTMSADDGSWSFKINGKTGSAELVGFVWVEEYQTYLPSLMLTVNGHFNSSKNPIANGTYEAWLIFIGIPDATGMLHVGPVLDSYIELTGKWKP